MTTNMKPDVTRQLGDGQILELASVLVVNPEKRWGEKEIKILFSVDVLLPDFCRKKNLSEPSSVGSETLQQKPLITRDYASCPRLF